MRETIDKLRQAIRLIEQADYMLLATVDETGTPRFTSVEELTAAGEDRITIRAWIETPPLTGRPHGGRIALLLWQSQGLGYQLTGQAVRSQEAAVLNGVAEVEQETHFPQIERQILMQVESVEEFHFAPAHPPQSRA